MSGIGTGTTRDTGGNQHNPNMDEMIAERERMRLELEELRRQAANQGNFDPNHPLREFTAHDPQAINYGYQRPNIGALYQIPPA